MQKRIPILFVVHSMGHGGMERQIAVLAAGLQREGYTPHVASVLGGFRAEELRSQGIPLLTIPIRSFWNPGPLALSGFLARYIREHGIGLVHSFDPGMSLVALLAAKRSGVPLLSSQRFYMDLLQPRHRHLLRIAHRFADAIVANCQELRDYLHRVYGYGLDKIEVCYNGVDTEAFSPAGRERLPELRDAEVVMGTVCVLRAEKNLPHLVEAFAELRREAPGARLLIMGSGPEEAALHALTAKRGLAGSSHFLPSGADVRAAMRSMDVFVSTSLSEGLPNAVMEAMACGCCVVATRVGGCAELIEPGRHGLLVEPNNLKDLTGALRQVIQDPDRRRSMGAAAAARMQEQFSIPASIRRMQAIYERRRRGE